MRVRIIFLSFTILILMVFSACQAENANRTDVSTPKTEILPKGSFAVDFKTEPAAVKSGEKANLIFTVKNDLGETVKNLQISHEKAMHLLIVSEDLEEFYHHHPEADKDGNFRTDFIFPNGGKYNLYADFTPPGGEQTVKNFSLVVSGGERTAKEVKPDESPEKTVENLRVALKTGGNLIAGKEAVLSFDVFDAQTNNPVTDLENYLGAKAHFVVISKDLQEFVHAHPMNLDAVKDKEHRHDNEKLANPGNISVVNAHITFPKPSVYRIWAQFKRGGKVVTIPFTVEVKQGEAEQRLEKVEIPPGAFKIVVSRDGFTPEEVTFQKGQPLKLAFFRADEENCGNEIVLKELNIKKSLPVGEVVLVDVPTDKAKTINFTCGMNMYKGKIIIE